MVTVDVYPVGWLAALRRLRVAYGADMPVGNRAEARAWAWARLRGLIRAERELIRARQWRSVKNSFNGYLAEPTPFPDGMRRCGSGWTRRRALRSLQRHARRPGVRWEELDRAITAALND